MHTALPTGTVTFLFTDIEGSTSLAGAYPLEMPALLSQHHALLRQAIEANHGHVFQIIGDAFCAAFFTAADALRAAHQAQRLLQQADWHPAQSLKVRMGIHTGPAQAGSSEAVAGGYASNLTLARTQRVMSAASGGQVLLSSASAELLRGELPEGVQLRDLGEQRLKGLSSPERLWQLVAPDILSEFPNLQSPGAVPTNLPVQLSSFIGREGEIAEVVRLLKTTRLLTLTGPPGIGKTRLSIQVAAELLDQFEEGVYFVPLAPINDVDLVARAITQTLAIIESGNWTPIAALKNYFGNKTMLLVLDNFEHVLDAAPLVVDLLQSCPGLKILATSRAPLKISGERQYPLGPLGLPDLERLPDISTLAKFPSITLFVARACLVEPEFTLTEANARQVAVLCHHLDGLPLAIELTAAWVKLLPPQKLLDRLGNRLSLLRGGPVDQPLRQRTLRAAIDWSYELLDTWGQRLLARLTIFVGGWTLEAAGAVAGWNGAQSKDISPGDVLEGLFNLVDKSLVNRQWPADGRVRFAMLETICEYATEKLVATGEIELLGRRHAAYYLELAEASEPELRGPQQQLWLTRLKDEHNNLRAALGWAFDHHEAEMALKLAGSLWRYWWMHGHFSEGRDWLERALVYPEPQSPAWRAKALHGLGILARSQGDYANARLYLEECLEIRRTLDDRTDVAFVLNSLGALAQYQEDYDRAFKYHQESLAIRRELGEPRGIAVSLNNLAMVAHEQGEFDQAEELYSESLTLFHQVNDARGIAATLSNRGALMNDQGNARQAEAFFSESLSILKELGQRDDIIECLEGFAGIALLSGQPRRAARLLGAAQALRETIGAPVPPYKRLRLQRIMGGVAAQLDPKMLESELTIGRKMSLDEAIVYALEQ
jgi:predicted ATPase/class 3 adenylate cyclase